MYLCSSVCSYYVYTKKCCVYTQNMFQKHTKQFYCGLYYIPNLQRKIYNFMYKCNYQNVFFFAHSLSLSLGKSYKNLIFFLYTIYLHI